jgi:acyl carrier protein
MKPTQPEILAYVLKTVQDLCQDWDYADPVGPESLLFTGLGMESLDAVVLCTAMQEHYQTTMPFAELLADIGQKQRDLSIAELAEFVGQHVGAGAQAEQRAASAWSNVITTPSAHSAKASSHASAQSLGEA